MGNEVSAPAPTVIEQEPPAGSGESSMVYPDRPDTPRLDGVTRSIANDCSKCSLQISSGISSSSVKISREFGEVSEVQCGRYSRDLKRVREKQMSIQDFIGNLQSSRYLRNLQNGFCEQVELPGEEAAKVTKIEEFDENKLLSVRIQKMSSGGFSSDTKAKLEPSIPFELIFNGERISVKTMSVYHPCPLRLEGVQPDAVMCLNDPSFGDPNYVIIVPLVARNSGDPSVGFFDKVLSQIGSVTAPDASRQYPVRNVPTGENWTLAKLFNVEPTGDGRLDVTNGYYEWKGMPALERVREDGPGTITYSWKESGAKSPRYIMLDTPVAISSTAMANIVQALPVTAAQDAIHAVLYNSNPLQRGIAHKQGPPGANCGAKEGFTDLQGVYELGTKASSDAYNFSKTMTYDEEACDPWTLWAQASAGKGFTAQQISAMIFNSLVFVAMAIGAYLAFNAVLRLYDVKYSELSIGIGKVTAVFAKNLQQKAAALQQKISVGIPGLPMGPGGLKALAAGDVSKLAGSEADLAKLAGVPPGLMPPSAGDVSTLAGVPPGLIPPAAAPPPLPSAPPAVESKNPPPTAAAPTAVAASPPATSIRATRKKRNIGPPEY